MTAATLPKNSSTLPLAAPAPRTDGYSATSDRERASRLRSAPVAISRGFDLTRPYFDGGCPMPATSAVEPRVLPVEGAAPVSAVEHVRPSTGRANERTALPDVSVGRPSRADGDGDIVPSVLRPLPTGATGLAAITDDAEAATAGEPQTGHRGSPANLSMADTVRRIVGAA